MEHVNFLAILAAAIVPTITGFVWYNPKVFGNAWMQAAGVTEEKMKGANMGLIFGLSFVLSFLLAFNLNFLFIHQFSVGSLFMADPGFNDPNSEVQQLLGSIMAKYGTAFRTFSHGVVHGILTGIFLVLPILGTNAMFERKGWKYILINVGYWTLTLALMGGIICAWMK